MVAMNGVRRNPSSDIESPKEILFTNMTFLDRLSLVMCHSFISYCKRWKKNRFRILSKISKNSLLQGADRPGFHRFSAGSEEGQGSVGSAEGVPGAPESQPGEYQESQGEGEDPSVAGGPPPEGEWWVEQVGTDAKLFQTIENENIVTDQSQLPESLVKTFKYIDENEKRFVQSLRDAVAIRSVSVWPEARNECYRMIQFATDKLKELGFEIELRKMGIQECNGEEIPLPPVIFAKKGDDPKKKTLLIYGHLDVQPANKADGWYCEPFYLTEEGNCLYGRGSSDDKGPVMGWFHAIESFVKSSIRLPINIKFVLESMEEAGSDGLANLLKKQKDGFLSGVDLVTMSDNYWLGKNKPCVCYGLRGLCYFFCEVESGTRDLHSGVYGGTLREAMPDLIWLLDQLVDAQGTILIPGIMDHVCPLLPEEEELYKNIEFDIDDFQIDAGIKELRFPGNKNATLMNRWRFPALSIHGIQGAFDTPGAKVVIPRKVIGKFSIRLVPNQSPETVEHIVKTYIKAKWEERGSPNQLRIYMADDGMKPWCANPFHPSFKAARQAIGWAYGKIPDMIRDGGTVERVLAFQEVTGKNVLLLPMGSSDDAAHFINEKINRSNYVNGTKVFAAYIHEIGKLEKTDL